MDMKKGFISFKESIKTKLAAIVRDPRLHGLWLNTLSYLENCGAKKIARCEHPTKVRELMLKHASEEFRHAYYLKKQLSKITIFHEDYSVKSLLGHWKALHYLNKLDLQVLRYLIDQKIQPSLHKSYCYLLVTYVLECRAGELYPLYHECLKSVSSPIRVHAIILEEQEHLNEMVLEILANHIPYGFIEDIFQIEAKLFKAWLTSLETA